MPTETATVCVSLPVLFTSKAASCWHKSRTSLARGDASIAGRAAHTLQGSARVFASGALEQAALRLEVVVREQQFDKATAELAEVRRAVELLLTALNERLGETTS